ncbi:hypothetical protein OHS71_01620 [Streptomyces sp. NBC_00377]|uniref:hypothetical protein n=1 Tax=unclassified Streptomyces TaxID=2593676 RepID=UPI002E204D3C|nr:MULTISPECIES: hypothetical protein [unclassified Streptomyces]
MSTQNTTEERFSVALESIQGKRRIERVLEAANALLDRYATEHDPKERLRLVFELVRRNLTPEISITFSGFSLGTGGLGGVAGSEAVALAPSGGIHGQSIFHCKFEAADGRTGSLTAYYREPGPLGLTDAEWHAAMRLLAGVAGLGVGGHATCPS